MYITDIPHKKTPNTGVKPSIFFIRDENNQFIANEIMSEAFVMISS